MGDVLRIFEQNNTEKLYSVALKLFQKGIFSYYLSHQQLQVLEQILVHSKDAKNVFSAFINSKLSLKFTEPHILPDSQNQSDENTQKSNSTGTPLSTKTQDSGPKTEQKGTPVPTNGQLSNNKDKDKEDEKSKSKSEEKFEADDIIAEQTIANGVESARSLALKIRYILYDRAVLLHYNDLDDEAEYEILEAAANEIDVEKPSDAHAETQPKKTETNYDDDYDDEDDDEEEEEKESQDTKNDSTNGSNITKGTDTTIDQAYDSDGNLVLEVPIVQSDSNQFDPQKLIVNFNNIYHNFENDKETLIKRRKLEENDKLLEENDQTEVSDLFSMNLGAANLSLKHLLRSIDDNKEKLNLQDNELRQLIMDVRKNRSKWASDDKIGQEELYEACEKVVMELRGYTEYSTAFLNKVSKREAPNYSQVIKKPMDLNTILKKLKAFQYKSKTEFVDDVMLIWKNCLTYNSDPRHFLRAHAIAMQKKSLQLIPLIPDITVRDRSEVEAEAEAELDGEADSSTPAPSGKSTSKKGKKRTRNGEIKKETAESTVRDDTPVVESETKAVTNGSGVESAASATPAVQTADTATPSKQQVGESTEIEEDDNGETNEYLNTENNDKDDLEMSTWKNLTSKVRADLCIRRSELFKDQQLNPNTEAILSGSKTLKDPERKRSNDTKKLQTVFKPTSQKIEEEPYLLEYDMAGVLPSLAYKGLDEEEIELNEAKLVDKVLEQGGFTEPSQFAPKNGGLNKVINENIKEMQEIRKLCFKISLIRQMQQQQFLHHSQFKPPEIEEINDSIDLDPISRLENHDKFNKELIYNVLKKRVSKIAMLGGFESTEYFAIDTLTQVTGDFMDNLVKTLKTHIETPSVNKDKKEKNILHLSLLQNGIKKPDDLYIYVHENVLRQHAKLKDLRANLSNFLKTLLRPAVDLNNEKTFDDNSEQFVSGDFSNEIGEDFFGFKELGLDKEFGMIGNTIPLHLLHSRFAEVNQTDDVIHVKREPFEKEPFKRLIDEDIVNEIGLVQPFLRNVVLERTKIFNSKQIKSKRDVQEYLANATGVVLMDDEDYPKKQQKPKLPPNGKIPITKKKITAHTFFLPEGQPDQLQQKSQQQQQQQQQSSSDNLQSESSVKAESDFNSIGLDDDYDEDDEPLSSQVSLIPEISGSLGL